MATYRIVRLIRVIQVSCQCEWSALRMAMLGALLVSVLPSALAERIQLGGSGSTSVVAKVLAQAYQKKYPGDEVVVTKPLGSPGGLRALSAGAVDIALASRSLNAREAALNLNAVEFARTPLVMAVSSANPISDLAVANLSRLYAQPDATWPDGSRVRLVLRPRDDSDTRLVAGFSTDMAKAMQAALARPGMFSAATDDEAVSAIVRLPGAIGATTLAQILVDKLPLKALALDGIAPTVDAAASGRYPHHKVHYLVTRADAPAAVKRFIAFAQSAEAAALLRNNGCWVNSPKSGARP